MINNENLLEEQRCFLWNQQVDLVYSFKLKSTIIWTLPHALHTLLIILMLKLLTLRYCVMHENVFKLQPSRLLQKNGNFPFIKWI